MKKIGLLFVAFGWFACSGPELETQGDMAFIRYAKACEPETKTFWLIDMAVKKENDSALFSTRELGKKAELRIDQVNYQSALFQLLQGVCEGDSIFVVLRADSFYQALNTSMPNFLKATDKLKLMWIMHDRLDSMDYIRYKQAFEKQSIKSYVQKFNWDADYDTATGIYYEKLKSVRAQSQPFNKVKLKYVLKDLNDQLIAFSKDDDPLILNRGDSAVLKGIAFLADKLQEGESVRAVIPSNMAYGNQRKGRIKPYTPIVVELEYLERID